jgi:hypothetical protein
MALPRKRTRWCAGQIPGRPLRLSHSSGANLCGNFLRGATNNPEPRGTVNEGCGCEGVPNQPLGTRRRTASAFPPAPGLPFLFVSRECLAKSRLPDMHSPFERGIVETRKLARVFSMGAQRHECRLLAVRPPPQAEKLNVEVSVEEHRHLRQYHSTTRVRRSVRSPPDSAGRRITSEGFAKLQH